MGTPGQLRSAIPPLTITALHVGTLVDMPKPAIVFQHGWRETIDIAMTMFVIEGGEHPMVVDTGTGDPEATAAWHPGYQLRRPPDQEPQAQLERIGIDPDSVRTVVNTHLHWDHCANNALFPNARIMVQAEELRYAVAPAAVNRIAYEVRPGVTPSWLRGLDRMVPVHGETVVAPGVTLVPLPGHTPGSQGVLVEAPGARYLIAGDCIDTYENWAGDSVVPHCPSGLFTDILAYEQSFRDIEALDCEILPSHDLAVVAKERFG